jgi:hypothetical protein
LLQWRDHEPRRLSCQLFRRHRRDDDRDDPSRWIGQAARLLPAPIFQPIPVRPAGNSRVASLPSAWSSYCPR